MRRRRRRRPARVLVLSMLLLAAACSEAAAPSRHPTLPETSGEQFLELVATAGRPLVVNVWASWCVPCRSEAPLLREAHRRFGNEVRFVGIDVQDSQRAARAFLDEFRLDFENYFDPGRQVPAALGGRGVPITYFFASDGSLTLVHPGVIDERTLALQIDELLRS